MKYLEKFFLNVLWISVQSFQCSVWRSASFLKPEPSQYNSEAVLCFQRSCLSLPRCVRTLPLLPQCLPAATHVPENSPQRIYLAVLSTDIKTLACHAITQTWKQTPQNSGLNVFPTTIWAHVLSYFYNLRKFLYIYIKLLLIQMLLITPIMYLRYSLQNKNKTKIIWNMCFIFGKLLLHLKYSNCHFFL